MKAKQHQIIQAKRHQIMKAKRNQIIQAKLHQIVPLIIITLVGVTVLICIWLFAFFHGSERPLWEIILLILIWIVLLILLILARYGADWTGFKNKNLWEWLNLFGVLAVPLILGIATLQFTAQQAQSSLDQQQANTLQTYIDDIQDLMLNHNLLKYTSTNDVTTLANARTLTALQELDPYRKGVLLTFLHKINLIGTFNESPTHGSKAIISLDDADLSHAILSHAILSGADLSGADLSNADLTGAQLVDAVLMSVNLSEANLSGANLRDAILSGATLTQLQLDQVSYCSGATLPKGLTCHHLEYNGPGK